MNLANRIVRESGRIQLSSWTKKVRKERAAAIKARAKRGTVSPMRLIGEHPREVPAVKHGLRTLDRQSRDRFHHD